MPLFIELFRCYFRTHVRHLKNKEKSNIRQKITPEKLDEDLNAQTYFK